MNAPTKIEAGETTLLDALALALPQLEGAKKNSNNPHFKSKYADLGAVIEAIRPIAEHGLWFVQEAHENERGAMVETYYIGHGERLSAGRFFVPADKSNAQGYGSALTYARRYGLLTAFGLPTEDDDGNAAAAAPRAAGGQFQQEAVSPRQSYPFPAGPAKNITELKNMCRALWREIESCGDDGELTALLETTENKEITKQLSELDDPNHRQIWDGDGKDNPGISGLITRKQTEFAQRQTADQMTGYGRT